MAKRFTDTNKYKKAFYRSLPGAYKLLWDFLYHDCDNSGIWIIDFSIAQVYVGTDMPVEREQAFCLFNKDEVRIVEFDNKKKWLIPSFITFQYGRLSDKNRAHLSVISALTKHNFLNPDLTLINFPKVLTSPLQGAKDKEKDMDKAKDMDKEQVFGKSENLYAGNFLIPKMYEVWTKTIPHYSGNKERDFPALKSIADFIFKNSGAEKTYGDQDSEIKMLNTFQIIADEASKETFWIDMPLKSISNNIQKFYNKIKNPTNGQQKKSNSKASTREHLNDEFSKRYSDRKQT